MLLLNVITLFALISSLPKSEVHGAVTEYDMKTEEGKNRLRNDLERGLRYRLPVPNSEAKGTNQAKSDSSGKNLELGEGSVSRIYVNGKWRKVNNKVIPSPRCATSDPILAHERYAKEASESCSNVNISKKRLEYEQNAAQQPKVDRSESIPVTSIGKLNAELWKDKSQENEENEENESISETVKLFPTPNNANSQRPVQLGNRITTATTNFNNPTHKLPPKNTDKNKRNKNANMNKDSQKNKLENGDETNQQPKQSTPPPQSTTQETTNVSGAPIMFAYGTNISLLFAVVLAPLFL